MAALRPDLEAALRLADFLVAALRLADFLVAPPRLGLEADLDLEATRLVPLEADFLVAPPRLDLEALDLEAARFVPLEAARFVPLEAARFVLLEADLVPRDDLDADLDFALFELLDAPLRLADFLVALFLEDLPPERLLADFFDAAFLVDFAMLMGF